jgi:hypothetical protein
MLQAHFLADFPSGDLCLLHAFARAIGSFADLRCFALCTGSLSPFPVSPPCRSVPAVATGFLPSLRSSALEFVGEVFADFFGLYDSRYQYVLDAHERHVRELAMEKAERAEQRRAAREEQKREEQEREPQREREQRDREAARAAQQQQQQQQQQQPHSAAAASPSASSAAAVALPASPSALPLHNEQEQPFVAQ